MNLATSYLFVWLKPVLITALSAMNNLRGDPMDHPMDHRNHPSEDGKHIPFTKNEKM